VRLFYCNPVQHVIRFSKPEKIRITEVEIIDMSGRLLKTLKGSEEYNVADLSRGNYMLKIKGSELAKVTKLVKG
jgi:hypothetical protein